MYTFSLRGRGKLPLLDVDKSIIDLGDVFLGQSVSDTFKIFSQQSGFVTFKPVKIFQQIKIIFNSLQWKLLFISSYLKLSCHYVALCDKLRRKIKERINELQERKK